MILKGKNVVITGCLKGIGRSTLDLFVRHGANVWACCQEKDDSFELHVKKLQEENAVWIKGIYFDFSDEIQLKDAVKKIRSDKMVIDSLVNIAGITLDSRFHMISMNDLRHVFEINYFSQVLFTQYITKLMLKQRMGSVIFTSSIAATDGSVGQASYASSKAALIGLTKTLSAELGPIGIRVNAIAPGVIDTDMTKVVEGDSLKDLLELSALKKIGLPENVAGALAFLASDLATYITGQILRVDGGIG